MRSNTISELLLRPSPLRKNLESRLVTLQETMKRNGVQAFVLSLILLGISGGSFGWMYYSSMHSSSSCPEGYALRAADPRCRIPIIANYSFLGSVGLSVLFLCLGIRQRRDYFERSDEARDAAGNED